MALVFFKAYILKLPSYYCKMICVFCSSICGLLVYIYLKSELDSESLTASSLSRADGLYGVGGLSRVQKGNMGLRAHRVD